VFLALTYLLSVSDVVEYGLEGLGLEHHVLDEVHVQVLQVHLAWAVIRLCYQNNMIKNFTYIIIGSSPEDLFDILKFVKVADIIGLTDEAKFIVPYWGIKSTMT
jgi:hypothetical protein